MSLRSALKGVVPVRVRQALRDRQERLARRFPGRASGLSRFGLDVTQVYPKGDNFYPVLLASCEKRLANVSLTSKTPVASIGTCFAEEFAAFMLKQNYNYLRAEPDSFAASANWGRVYTIPNLHQIVRYSLEDDFPVYCEQGDGGWFDPLREYSARTGATKEAAVESIRAHRAASKRVLSEAEYFIVTVGQNEGWIDQTTDMVWARIPPKALLEAAPDRFTVRQFTYEENLSLLERSLAMIFGFNPRLRVIVTVSPVASAASFTSFDVISESFANKCLLRTVVAEIEKRFSDRVFYFPSFEAVLCYNPTNFRADNRHVQFGAVGQIFRILATSTRSNRA